MSVKLSGNLPKGDANGLIRLAARLVHHPEDVHVVIALIKTKKLTTDVEEGDVVPHAVIRRIEVVPDEDKHDVRRLLERAFERRTGETMLPFELEKDIAAAFDGMDLATGEVPRPDNGDGQA